MKKLEIIFGTPFEKYKIDRLKQEQALNAVAFLCVFQEADYIIKHYLRFIREQYGDIKLEKQWKLAVEIGLINSDIEKKYKSLSAIRHKIAHEPVNKIWKGDGITKKNLCEIVRFYQEILVQCSIKLYKIMSQNSIKSWHTEFKPNPISEILSPILDYEKNIEVFDSFEKRIKY